MTSDGEFYNNLAISKLFKELKNSKVTPILKDFDDLRITFDEERVFQFSNGVIEYEEFKINLSIPFDRINHENCFGVYLSICVPQYGDFGVLFSPEDDKFKITSLYGYKIIDNFFSKINQNKIFTYDECLIFSDEVIKLFLNFYKKRQELIVRAIKKLYKGIENEIIFKEIEVDFLMRVTKNRNKYIYFYSKELNTVFFNDVFKTNYKSVINGIEEIAMAIINKVPDIDFETVQWKNIFININNSGIIFQNIKLEVKKIIDKKNWIQKYLFGQEDKEYFIEYIKPDFSTEYHLEKDKCIEIWNNIIKN